MEGFVPDEEQYNSSHDRKPEAPAIVILSVLFAFMVLGALIAGGVTIGAAVMYQLDPSEAMSLLKENSSPAVRSFFRWSQGISHLLLFVVSSIATIYALLKAYRLRRPYFIHQWANSWTAYFNMDRIASVSVVLLGIVLMLCALPLVQYSYALNKGLPLPDWMRTMESETADAIKGLLTMDNAWEFLGNFLVIAILPGLGEELVFRGIVQPQMHKITQNGWAAVLITAFVFSAIHMQFEGFLPRFLLGAVLGWLYWQTRNLWVPIIAHLFNNGIQVLGVYLYKEGITQVDIEQDVAVPWYIALGSLALMIGLGMLIQTKMDKKTA